MKAENLITKTVQEIPPSGIRKYFDLLGDDYISLGVGEPDFPTPEGIRGEALKILSTGRIPYSSNSGIMELRELILKYLDVRLSIGGYSIPDTLVTVGSSQAIDLALRALINPMDEVIYAEPAYVAYKPCIRLAGGVPVPIVTTDKTRFKITPEALKAAITPKTKALILPYPNNPTGAILEKDEVAAIADVLRNTDIVVLTDDIYAELTYNGKKHFSIVNLPGMRERTIMLNGFSKAFSMTGWRLGFAVGPSELIAAMTKIHQLTMLSAPTTAQVAGIVAVKRGLETNWEDIEAMKEEYDERRRFLVDALNSLGMTCPEPEGAFYAFPSIKHTGLASEEFADKLVANQKVVVIPGTAFGPTGEGHVRLCYATDLSKIKQAIDRIAVFLKTL